MDNSDFFNAAQTVQSDALIDEQTKSGFTSTARHLMVNAIDLNRDLTLHAESTFYARVQGDSMSDVGVGDGDILVVDKSIDWQSGDMAVCIFNGEFIVRFLDMADNRMLLLSANETCQPVEICEGDNFEIWGVVTYVIRKMRGRTRK